MPPKVAPIQIVIIQCKSDEDKEKIIDYVKPLFKEFDKNMLILLMIEIKCHQALNLIVGDEGVPIRIEVGMRDINDDAIIYSRRDKQGKHKIDIGSIKGHFPNLLDDIQQSLFDQAKEFQESNTHTTNSYDDFKNIIKKGGFVKCGWDGTNETEENIKRY